MITTGNKVDGKISKGIPPRWQPTVEKIEKYYLLKNFWDSMKQTSTSWILLQRHGVLPLTQFCYILKTYVSKFDPCKWRLKSWKESQSKVSFNCFYRCHHPAKCFFSFLPKGAGILFNSTPGFSGMNENYIDITGNLPTISFA